jgi:hypothetical protein
MSNITNRLAALEQQTNVGEPLMLIVTWHNEPETARYAEVHGERVSRLDGESYDAFELRLQSFGESGKPLVVFLGGCRDQA